MLAGEMYVYTFSQYMLYVTVYKWCHTSCMQSLQTPVLENHVKCKSTYICVAKHWPEGRRECQSTLTPGQSDYDIGKAINKIYYKPMIYSLAVLD